jgi:hypothetical protein
MPTCCLGQRQLTLQHGGRPQHQQTNAWSPGSEDPQRHRHPQARAHLSQPVPITARVLWADDGEEHLDTVALGWTGGTCTCGCRTGGTGFTSVWLDAADATRR